MSDFLNLGFNAVKNEPASGWDPRNFPEVMRLLEDPLYGRGPSSDGILSLEGIKGNPIAGILGIQEQLKNAGVYDLIDKSKDFESQLLLGQLSPELNQIMSIILDDRNKAILDNLITVFPRTVLIIDAWAALVNHQQSTMVSQTEAYDSLQDDYMKAFGDGFESALGYENTAVLIKKWFIERENIHPNAIHPWEMRIGGSRFFVPPISVSVNQTFKTGSLAGGALRQQNSPKFNSGHSETMIDLVLYFPNHESIWGYDSKGKLKIDFDKDGEKVIDQFTSSLRGLITQFKYSPFLPVRNEYLNRTYDITGVTLHSMSIQTVEGFPFCLAVNLQLLKFNFKAYLPPVSDFNQAVHWGRFRQYIGRAAQKLNSVVSEGFLIEEKVDDGKTDKTEEPDKTDEDEGQTGTSIIRYEHEPRLTFDKLADFEDGKHFQIYFPEKTPAKIFAPDTSDFRQDGEDMDSGKEKSGWEFFMNFLGFEVDNYPESVYDVVDRTSSGGIKTYKERDVLLAFLESFNATAETMISGKLDEYIKTRADELKLKGEAREEFARETRTAWFNIIFDSWKHTPFFQKYIENSKLADGHYLIKEWQVPMRQMYVDWNNVHVEGVTVSLANNIVRQQLQLQDEPVHQHIGGRDSTVNISMIVFGEDDLIRFRRVFEHVSGLARLEHAHGTLGFLGIKNVVTALAGIKYVLPMSFQIDHIEGYPHVYRVNMSFVDFDIFQQKREELSSAQQTQLVEAFGKRNPFLRIKQLWGCVDENTEILTIDGWKSHDELNELDQILTLNHDTGYSEWEHLQGVNVYEVDTELLELSSENHKSLTSMNHRWPTLHKGRKNGKVVGYERIWTTSEELNSNDYIITSASHKGIPSSAKFSDSFVDLIAWIWTSGNIELDETNPRIKIYQSEKINSRYVDQIRASLHETFDTSLWSEKRRENGMIQFTISTEASREIMEVIDKDRVVSLDFIRSLTRAQLELFIASSMNADGHWRGKTGLISQSQKERLDHFEYAVVLSGRATSLKYVETNGLLRWELSIRDTSTYNVPARKDLKKVQYKGIIWCPTTNNSSWFARKDGHTFYTGNSFNAYPDFPLAVRDDESNIVGHLDPDFYFRAYQMFDDDIAYWGLDESDEGSKKSEVDGVDAYFGGHQTGKSPDQTSNSRQNAEERRIKAIDDILRRGGLVPAEVQKLEEERKFLSGNSATDSESAGDANPTQAYGGITFTNDSLLSSKTKHRHEVTWAFGLFSEDQAEVTNVKIDKGMLSFGQTNAEGGEPKYGPKSAPLKDNLAEDSLTRPSIEGFTSYAGYQNAHADAASDPAKQWELMMTDAAYRDISGRMIRAFPTYMLWLIDEGGRFAGVKLFDNFYGLQSIIDLSLDRSEDVLGDTLVLRVSNLYKKLSTPYAGYLFREQGADYQSEGAEKYGFVDLLLDVQRNIQSGTYLGKDASKGIVDLDTIRLKPGVRLHLRLGYSSNPNSLDTVFNGTVTEVRSGDIVEIIAQSDAIELSPYINTTNKDGHSGKLDGSLTTGMWLSEPRDLMVRLLSMGSSSFKEGFAHATKGMIFSESKFGIRHFGQILYEPLTDEEDVKHQKRYDRVKSALDSAIAAGPTPSMEGAGAGANAVGNVPGALFDAALGNAATRSPLISVMQSMWTNFFRSRDYELFKRNIYPGNGLGIAQYLGGDTIDGGLTLATAFDSGDEIINKGTPVPGAPASSAVPTVSMSQEAASARDIATGGTGNIDYPDPNDGSNGVLDFVEDATTAGGRIPTVLSPVARSVSAGRELADVFTGKSDSPILQAMGIAKPGEVDDDLVGFDEVSFRAQTYMKSVWDLFQLCAALLPNYIVAVRPFEDRSTVFYGKPHWLYTSGVIPITLGVPADEGPQPSDPDEDLQKLLAQALEGANAFADLEQQTQFFETAGAVSPYDIGSGIVWSGDINDIKSGPLIHEPSGCKIPAGTGLIAAEMHLPTSADINTDTRQHMQLVELPDNKRHPWYMDRADPGDKIRGGVSPTNASPSQGETVLKGEKAEWGGRTGGFGFLAPEIEQWYMNMRWDYKAGGKSEYLKRRVLIYCEKTGKACVAVPAEWGPGGESHVAGASPDVMHVLGASHGDKVWICFVDDNTRLGPTSGSNISSNASQTTSDGSVTLPSQATYGPLERNASLSDSLTGSSPNSTVITTIENLRQSFGLDPDSESTKGMNKTLLALYESILGDMNFTTQETGNFGMALAVNTIHALGIPGSAADAANNNPILWAYEYGALTPDVPVWLIPSAKDPLVAGSVDIVGITARRLYDKDYNDELSGGGDLLALMGQSSNANYGPGEFFTDHSGQGGSGGRSLKEANEIWKEFRADFGEFGETQQSLSDWFNNLIENPDAPGSFHQGPGRENDNTDFISKVIARFVRFMWQEPYARAWLVITSSRHFDANNLTDASWGPISFPDFDADKLPLISGALEGLGLATDGDSWNFRVSPVTDLFRFYLISHDPNTFDERDPKTLKYKGGGGRQGLIDWMKKNNKQGIDSAASLDRAIENLKDTYDKTIGRIWKAISSGLSSILALYRISMGQLGSGLENVHAMQQQANILNKVFNDSIYYAAGNPGSLLRLADNPFTREYAEPVIEIREPFQRMHYLNSFQHIISNNITENLNDVSTVITATSDGNYPVTVYFDKGAPPERQTEKVVETGLFWDNARGSGFLGGFLHPLIHPIETARGLIKNATGSSDELTSKRVGLYHLRESLKDIYTGELVVLGNPEIRPFDLVYLGDVYERMYGMFEVERVIHHFTPELGFITSITPNALVTINDPARWSMLSWVWSWFEVKNVRDDVKMMLQRRGKDSSPLSSGGVTLEELAESLDTQLKGHLQYAHGNSAIIKDIASAAALGNMGIKTKEAAIAEGRSRGDISVGDVAGTLTRNLPGVAQIMDLMEAPWKWVKDNLIDQHGCYIQYLNKDGQPMDSGLSYNQGVAVGRHHSVTILPGILGLDVNVYKDGHKRITTNDLLAQLGWNEIDIIAAQKDLSFFTSQTNAQVLKLAGKSPDEIPFVKPEVHIVEVANIFDGDTFVDTKGGRWRLAGVNAAEVSHTNMHDGRLPVDLTYAQTHMSYRAAAFLQKRLIDDPRAMGHKPTVAIRYGVNAQTYDRLAAVVFHNVPEGTAPEDRDRVLEELAGQWPINEWDSYMNDGKPYTINWEIIAAGLALTSLYGNNFDTDRGVTGIGDGR